MLALNKWGPSGWHFIHAVMMTAPEKLSPNEIEEMKAFLVLFGRHLPCPKCRIHFRDFLAREANDARYASRDALVQLMNDCHNDVNRRLGKPEFTLEQHYAYMATGKKSSAEKFCCIVAITVLLVAVAAHEFENKVRPTTAKSTLKCPR